MNYTPTIPPPEDRRTNNHSPQPSVIDRPIDRPIDRRTSKLITSFGHAFAGLWYLLRTQRNAQIHCLIGTCALTLGAFLGLARWEWLALILTIGMVLAAEGVNTAIEATVDVATTRYHPLARIAKDVGAGSVLLCAMISVIVGCIIFMPHLWPIIVAILDFRL